MLDEVLHITNYAFTFVVCLFMLRVQHVNHCEETFQIFWLLTE